MEQPKPETPIEKAVEKVAEDLNIELPETANTPFGYRMITLLVLLGGIAIVGNVFSDNFSFHNVNILLYFARLAIGLLLVMIAYGLNKRRFYAVWLMGAATIISMISDLYLAIVPLLVFIYLYRQQEVFIPKYITIHTWRLRI